MIFQKLHIALLIISFSICCYGQDTSNGYRIDGDEVVFTFNLDDYEYLKHDVNSELLGSNDIFIQDVFVAGEFNDWSRNQWKMIKLSKTIYELRKKVSDFIDEFDWEFKFIVNSEYWAEPDETIENITPASTMKGKPLHVYNLRMFTAYPSETGNAIFKLRGHQDANEVILSGTFNRWHESVFKMNRTDEGWELILQLSPDLYEYKFIVDGEWMEDPDNPSKKQNEFHGYNSLIDIKKEVTFILNDHASAEYVVLAGDFNDWSEDDVKMEKTETGWTYTMFLSRGKYHYKFIVDGKWMIDPDNTVKEYDGKGNINSVCMVK